MKRIGRVVLLAGLLLILLASCTAGPEQQLIGKWQGAGGSETIEFLKGGTFRGVLIWDMTHNAVGVNGTFTVRNDSLTLKPEQPQNLVPMSCKITFSNSGKELTVNYIDGGAIKRDGSVVQYRRIS